MRIFTTIKNILGIYKEGQVISDTTIYRKGSKCKGIKREVVRAGLITRTEIETIETQTTNENNEVVDREIENEKVIVKATNLSKILVAPWLLSLGLPIEFVIGGLLLITPAITLSNRKMAVKTA